MMISHRRLRFISYRLLKYILLIVCLNPSLAIAEELDAEAVSQFIESVSQRHGLEKQQLRKIFRDTKLSKRVLKAISKPAEAQPWYKYRKIFVKSSRIKQGVKFWEKHKAVLNRAEQIYGVPANIIVAIIGVETRYGKFTGKDRVIDALATLAFHYPKRSNFFRGELEEYLLLTREQNINPMSIEGSYAGAMGIPQFIPSSYRRYAVDFDNDDKIDIWHNAADAIGSVGNYLHEHGWQRGQAIAVPATVSGNRYQNALNDKLMPQLKVDELPKHGITHNANIPVSANLKLLKLELAKGHEFWLGLDNFYVITRYNRSTLYAMATYQLAEKIKSQYADNQ